MANQLLNLPVPDRLNLDLSPSQLDPNESPNLTNMLVHEPGQLRRRKGYQARVSFASLLTVAGSDTPLQIITAPSIYSGGGSTITPTRALVTFVTGQNALVPDYRISSPDALPPSGFTRMANTDTIPIFVNADNPTSITAAAFTGGTSFAALTPPAMYDNSAYWTNAVLVSTADKVGNTVSATRLVRWAGVNTAGLSIWATINNGATTGTIWTNAGGTIPPVSSLAGCFLSFGEATGFGYKYLITSHVAGASAFTIEKPYGLGASTANVPNRVLVAGSTLNTVNITNAPPGCTCAIVHYDRLFVGRPRLTSAVGVFPVAYYPNAIAWSDAGEPQKWTDTNFIQLDSNPSDAIMGFGHVGDNLVIFTRYKIWVMYGTDEDSFTVRKFSDSIGCLDARSITQYGNGLFFMSPRGMQYFDGYQLFDVTQSKPGHGIRTGLQTSGVYFTNDTPRSQQFSTVMPGIDYLLVGAQEAQTNSSNDSGGYMQYIPTGAWTSFAGSTGYTQHFAYTKPGMHLNNKAMAVTRTGLLELTGVFESEYPTTQQNRWDQWYNAAGVLQNAADVLATIQFKDFELFGGDTGRLHQLFVEHSLGYYGASDANITGWPVTIGVDPNLDTSVSAGTVASRWLGNVSESATVYQRYFTTQLQDSFPLEGSIFRITLSTSGTALTNERPQATKFFQVRALVERTREGRVDNPVTS